MLDFEANPRLNGSAMEKITQDPSLTPKSAVLYLRVSTTEQAERGNAKEGFSIPAQRDAGRKKAAELGAFVIKEFVDRGASAKSADRPALQEMLEYIKDHSVDFVIVHKLDRLARNRLDDVAITQAIDKTNARLVSTMEAIDKTASGMLLHGIMSSVSEFFSNNLATEVRKGMRKKVEQGGTVSKAPLGYRNIRTVDALGREMRTVELDPERAPLLTQAFELYATGKYTIEEVADKMALLGLSTLPTPRVPSKPITRPALNHLFVNPYYKGMVKYQDAYYAGNHERITTPEIWQKVQDIMKTRINGERTRKNPHFLKSTVYCGVCGGRLDMTSELERVVMEVCRVVDMDK